MGEAISRERAWSELHDASTPPERLAAIAQAHPEFAQQIADHPRSYEALRAWAAQETAAAPGPDVRWATPDPKKGSWVARHKVATAVIAAVTAVVVGAGGYFGIRALMPPDAAEAPQAAETPGPQSSASSNPSTPAPTSPREPETPPQIALSELQLTHMPVHGVWASSTQTSVEIYDPRLAERRDTVASANLSVPIPVATRDRTEITNWGYTLAGRGNDLRVVFTYEVRTQADGLTPESFENRLRIVDPFEVAQDIDVSLPSTHPETPEDTTRILHMLTGAQGSYVLAWLPATWYLSGATWAFSTETGELLWQVTETMGASSGGTVALWGAVPAGGACSAIVFRDLRSGDKISEHFSGKTTGNFGRELCADQLTVTATGLYQVRQDGLALLDPAKGSLVMDFPLASALLPDPVGPYIFARYGSSAPYGVSIWDTRTGESVLDLEHSAVSRLDFSLTTVFDGFLYFRNTDEAPVIDLRTGEKVAADFAEVPVGAVSGVWAWMRDVSSNQERLVPIERGAWYGQ